jgi:hypothetical protein
MFNEKDLVFEREKLPPGYGIPQKTLTCFHCSASVEFSQVVCCMECGSNYCKECNIDHKTACPPDDQSLVTNDPLPKNNSGSERKTECSNMEQLIAEEEQRVNMNEYADWF